jgi:hypothetical protein
MHATMPKTRPQPAWQSPELRGVRIENSITLRENPVKKKQYEARHETTRQTDTSGGAFSRTGRAGIRGASWGIGRNGDTQAGGVSE